MNEPAAKNSKSNTRLRIARAVLKLEISKGHLAWKVTDLVRAARISRTLVYRYFGQSKELILAAAFKEFTDEFFGFNEDPASDFIDRLKTAYHCARETPELIMFYLYWRNRESDWKKKFEHIEKQLRQNIRLQFPNLNEHQVAKAHVVLHGLVTAPFLPIADLERMATELFSQESGDLGPVKK